MQEMQEPWVQSLGQKDPLEEEMATHSSILAWKIPWTKEAVQSMGSQRVGYDSACTAHIYILIHIYKYIVFQILFYQIIARY